jgi:hypothetical protein
MKVMSSFAAKAAIAAVMPFAGAAHAQEAEIAGARVPVENYVKAHATGDRAFIRKAFHPDEGIYSYRDGKLPKPKH